MPSFLSLSAEPIGAHTKFTHDRLNAIIHMAKVGMYESNIATAVGIHVQTLNKWIQQGKELDEYFPDVDYDTLREAEGERVADLVQFYRDWCSATTLPEFKALEAITDSFTSDWKAAESWLKLRFPEKWHPNRASNKSGDVTIKLVEVFTRVVEGFIPVARRGEALELLAQGLEDVLI